MPDRNPLWDVIQRYMDDPRHRYSPRPADLSRETGLSAQLLSKWKQKPTLPEPDQLIRLSRGTGISYPRLLEAALDGKGYFIGQPSRVVSKDFLAGDNEFMEDEDRTLPFARTLSLAADEGEGEATIQEQQEEPETP